MTSIPTLDAYSTKTDYKVWCRYCQKWHIHGQGDGHRMAHCYLRTSPYMETGYFIKLAGAWQDRPSKAFLPKVDLEERLHFLNIGR